MSSRICRALLTLKEISIPAWLWPRTPRVFLNVRSPMKSTCIFSEDVKVSNNFFTCLACWSLKKNEFTICGRSLVWVVYGILRVLLTVDTHIYYSCPTSETHTRSNIHGVVQLWITVFKTSSYSYTMINCCNWDILPVHIVHAIKRKGNAYGIVSFSYEYFVHCWFWVATLSPWQLPSRTQKSSVVTIPVPWHLWSVHTPNGQLSCGRYHLRGFIRPGGWCWSWYVICGHTYRSEPSLIHVRGCRSTWVCDHPPWHCNKLEVDPVELQSVLNQLD